MERTYILQIECILRNEIYIRNSHDKNTSGFYKCLLRVYNFYNILISVNFCLLVPTF